MSLACEDGNSKLVEVVDDGKFVKISIQVDGVEAEVRSRLRSENFKGELWIAE